MEGSQEALAWANSCLCCSGLRLGARVRGRAVHLAVYPSAVHLVWWVLHTTGEEAYGGHPPLHQLWHQATSCPFFHSFPSLSEALKLFMLSTIHWDSETAHPRTWYGHLLLCDNISWFLYQKHCSLAQHRELRTVSLFWIPTQGNCPTRNSRIPKKWRNFPFLPLQNLCCFTLKDARLVFQASLPYWDHQSFLVYVMCMSFVKSECVGFFWFC